MQASMGPGTGLGQGWVSTGCQTPPTTTTLILSPPTAEPGRIHVWVSRALQGAGHTVALWPSECMAQGKFGRILSPKGSISPWHHLEEKPTVVTPSSFCFPFLTCPGQSSTSRPAWSQCPRSTPGVAPSGLSPSPPPHRAPESMQVRPSTGGPSTQVEELGPSKQGGAGRIPGPNTVGLCLHTLVTGSSPLSKVTSPIFWAPACGTVFPH